MNASEFTKPVLVVGHRNPDADAICSAIGYAAFKHAQGKPHYQAVRCGNSNARIDAILSRFNVPLPPFVGDVTPRVSDIMNPNTRKISERETCAHALEMIDYYDVRALPVVTDDNVLRGLITIFDLGEFFTPQPKEPRKMRHVHTSIQDIVDALKADVLNIHEAEQAEDLFVRIGAMDIKSFGEFSDREGIKPEQSIIVVGDRRDIQEKSLDLGVRLLVITGGLSVDEAIVNRARKEKVSLIVSAYDSATTSWVIRTATRLSPLISKQVFSFHREEKLAMVKRRIADAFAPLYTVIDDEGHLLGVFSKTDILKPVNTRIVLMDHNELSQAVPGAAEVTIEEIIDHHRLGNPPTQQPILFRNEPVGSTCTIVAGLYQTAGLDPEPEIAGVLMGGLIADTLNLQSPTSTARDAELLPWLAKIARVSVNDLAEVIFSSGSVIVSQTPEEVITSDCKVYHEGELSFSVSQVEELGYSNFWKNADALKNALEEYRQREELYFASLLVTDINRQDSLFVLAGPPEFADQISHAPTEHPGVFDMPSVVSRKKQLIPYLTSLVKTVAV